MCRFEKKVAEYKAKVFQRDSVNIFGKPNFMSTCSVDKDLIYATANNEIYQLHLQRYRLGIFAEVSLVAKAPSERLSGINATLRREIFAWIYFRELFLAFGIWHLAKIRENRENLSHKQFLFLRYLENHIFLVSNAGI